MKSTHFESLFAKKEEKHLEVFYHKIGLWKRYRHPNRLLVRKVFFAILMKNSSFGMIKSKFLWDYMYKQKVEINSSDRFSAFEGCRISRSILMKFTYHHVDFGKGLLIPNYHLTVCASMNLKSNLNFRAAKNFQFADCRRLILGVNSKSPTDNINFFVIQ